MRKRKEKQDSEKESRFPTRASGQLLCQRNQQNITPGAPGMGPSSVFIPRNIGIDIRYVQILILACLSLDLNKEEVASIISRRAGISPTITRIAWNILKVERPELFREYLERLILRQISMSNQSLEHYPPPAQLAPSAPLGQGYYQNLLVGTLHDRDTSPLQVPIPINNLQIYSASSISSRQFVNDEDSASSSSQPTQKINHGRGMEMDRDAADIAPPPPFNKMKIPSLVSVSCNDQKKKKIWTSDFDAKASHPFSSYLPLPMEQQGEIFIEQQGDNFMEQQGPGSSRLTVVKGEIKSLYSENIHGSLLENPPSAMLIDSDTESSINVAQNLKLPSQSKEESKRQGHWNIKALISQINHM